MLDIFNDLTIVDSNGTVTKTKNIPCTYTPKEKLFYVLKEQDNENQLDTSLPKLALYIEAIDIALDRAMNTYAKRRFILSTSNRHYDYTPIPYNFTFGLSAFTKYNDHLAQIMENILPWFNPSLMIRVKEQGLNGLVREIPVVLNSYTPNVSNEITESERRIFQSDFNFVLEGWIYKPLNERSNIIYDFAGNIIDYTYTAFVSGGTSQETTTVSSSGTLNDVTYTVDYNSENANMG